MTNEQKITILMARYKNLCRKFENRRLAAKIARKIRLLGGEVEAVKAS